MKFGFCVVALAAALGSAVPIHAATISSSSEGNIRIAGEIRPGDEVDFAAKLVTLSSARPIEVYLDSSGGSVLTAVKIAEIVRKVRLTTRVPYRSECYSACVLIFAAGTERIANAESTIGVHSAGVPDKASADGDLTEDAGTLATTTVIARVMAGYGAPPSVIGKMVTTPTGKMTVLTLADLEAWNVRISRYAPGQETIQNSPSVAPAPVPMAPPPVLVQPSPQLLPAPLVWSENVKRVVATFGGDSWDKKLAYMRDKGARFERICKRAGCYFEATYTGTWATIMLSWTDARAGRPERQIWCVSDPGAWARACFDQAGRGGYVQRYDGSDWHRS